MGYANLANAFAYKEPFFSTKADQLAENDAWLKNNNLPDGAKAIFLQSSAPTGWTQDTTNNDYALRVVSGIGGGTGGSQSLASNITLNHLHTLTAAPDHDHDFQNHVHQAGTQNVSNFVNESITDYLANPGNSLLRWYRNDGGGSSTQAAASYTESAFSDDSGRSTAGAHNHTLGTNLTDTSFAYVDIIICSKDSDSGYTDETGSFGHNAKIIYDTFANLEANDNYNENRIPTFGSKMVWFQAAAPAGWTKTTSQNDKMLRLVSGAGTGTGGAQAIGTALSLVHSHSVTNQSGHNHTTGNHRHDLAVHSTNNARPVSDFISNVYYTMKVGSYYYISDGTSATQTALKGRTQADGSTTSGTNSQHNHNIGNSLGSIQPAYIDVIEATKDSTGSPYTFQDLTGEIVYKGLVSKQKLNAMGQNDEYLKFHTIPAMSKTLFFQATAPITWTQSTAQNDRCLRIVSGAGGGIGGSNGIGTGFPLGHTHSVNSRVHTHTFYHVHDFETSTQANIGNNTATADGPVMVRNSRLQNTSSFPSGSSPIVIDQFQQASTTSTTNSHNHGGTSQSALTTIILKYADVILCEKDIT